MLDLVVFFLVFYVVMSVNEWMVHKYYMHSDKFGSTHLLHHAETNTNMTLRKTSRLLDDDDFRGTAFSWLTVIAIALIAFPQALLLSRICLQNRRVMRRVFCAASAVIFFAFYQGIAWNSIHPAMHEMPPVPWWHGPPSVISSENAFLDVLRTNHERHHQSKGTCCFNVTLLGADYLFLTC